LGPSISLNKKSSSKKNKNNDNSLLSVRSEEEEGQKVTTTPDFRPMIRIIFWNSLGFFFFSFLIPFATSQLYDATGTQMGFTFASQTIGGLISAPIVGYLVDKVKHKKRLVLIGSFGRGASYIVMYFGIIFSSLITFAVSLFVLGFFVGFFWSPLDVLISEKSYKSHRSQAFGFRGGMVGKGNLLGSIISFTIFGLAIAFVPDNLFLVYSPLLFFMLSNVGAGLYFNKNVDESLTFERYLKDEGIYDPDQYDFDDEYDNGDSDSKLSKSEKLATGFLIGFSILMIAYLFSNMNQSIVLPFLQVFLLEDIGVTNEIIVMLVYFPAQVLSMLFAPKLGKITDKINPILGIIVTTGMGSLLTFMLINTSSPWIFSILLMLDFAFARAGFLIFQNLLSRISIKHRGKVFGTARWVSLGGAVIGPILGGVMWETLGHFFPFILTIIIELAIIPFYIIAIKYIRPHMTEKLEKFSETIEK
jgi:MFS family permease